jgi:hypothetical protein
MRTHVPVVASVEAESALAERYERSDFSYLLAVQGHSSAPPHQFLLATAFWSRRGLHETPRPTPSGAPPEDSPALTAANQPIRNARGRLR